MNHVYLLDADVFIRAKNDHYDMSFCPGFWDWLLVMRQANKIYSIEAIYNNLCQTSADEAEEDELSLWVRGVGKTLFLPHDEEMAERFSTVSNWAANQSYTQSAISGLFDCSDYQLIAYALAHGHTLVTHEVARNSKSKIKIPDACAGLNVKCISPFQMIRNEGARFILDVSGVKQ